MIQSLRSFGRIALFAFVAVGNALSTPNWPPASEGLTPDPAWKFGRLENGLRYALRRSTLPAGHVSLRLGVEVGFAHEQPGEAGFAHFVEHMVFNGTKRYPGDSLVAELQRHGIAIGPELSAFTFLTHTLYIIDAPSTTPKDLERWFAVLRDFADGATFDASEVKQERKVIASELRDRENMGTRAERARRRFLYPESPLGSARDGDVNQANRDALQRFYAKWYRPERMILVAAGDIEPERLEAYLQREFASFHGRGPAPTFNAGNIGNPATGQYLAVHDPSAGAVSIEVNSVLPYSPTDSDAARREWFASNLAVGILNQRLALIQRHHHGRVIDTTARSMLVTPLALETVVGVQVMPDEWPFAVETLDEELRRSLEFTFTKEELTEATAAMQTAYAQAVATAATRTSADHANAAINQLLWGMIPTSPADELSAVKRWTESLKPLDVSTAWRAVWQAGRASVFAYGFLPRPDRDVRLADLFVQASRRKIAPPRSAAIAEFAYTDFGPPGEIVKREYDAALDLHMVEFPNGVRLNLKTNDNEAGTVYLAARFGNGAQSEPKEKPGLAQLAAQSLITGGLSKHNPEEIERLFSNQSLRLDFYAEEDAFAFRGASSSPQVGRMLEVLSAYLTAPGWDPQSYAQSSTQMVRRWLSQGYSPEGAFALNVFRTLTGDDGRYNLASEHDIRACSLERAREWLEPQLHRAPLEVGLVGDLDVEATIALARRTLGALPTRDATVTPARPVQFAKSIPRGGSEFRFPGEPQRAGIQVIWPLEKCGDVIHSRRLEVLSAVLENRLRLKIREELGAAYVPNVTFWKSEVATDDGYFMAYLSVKASETKKLASLLQQIAHQLATKGLTADELQQAREPILARSVNDAKLNSYWTHHIIARAQSLPEVRTWPTTRERDFRQMTLEQLNATAHDILNKKRAMVFTALPFGI